MGVDISTGVLKIDGVRLCLADIRKLIQPGRRLYRPFVAEGVLQLIEFDERHAIWIDEWERMREE